MVILCIQRTIEEASETHNDINQDLEILCLSTLVTHAYPALDTYLFLLYLRKQAWGERGLVKHSF